MSSVAIVSVVWFTSTSWRRNQVSAPYRLRAGRTTADILKSRTCFGNRRRSRSVAEERSCKTPQLLPTGSGRIRVPQARPGRAGSEETPVRGSPDWDLCLAGLEISRPTGSALRASERDTARLSEQNNWDARCVQSTFPAGAAVEGGVQRAATLTRLVSAININSGRQETSGLMCPERRVESASA